MPGLRQWLERGLLLATLIVLGAATALQFTRSAEIDSATRAMPVRPGADTIIAVAVASTCPACADAETMERVRYVLGRIAEARVSESRTRLLGLSLDVDPGSGIAFLEQLGPFDEISVGGGWGNLLFSELLPEDSEPMVAVPQVFVLTREIDLIQGRLQERSRKVVIAGVGAESMLSWLETYLAGQTGP